MKQTFLYSTSLLFPRAGGSDGGAAGDLHPGHDGAGLHGSAEEETQGIHHEDCRLGEVQANVDECVEVAWISPCDSNVLQCLLNGAMKWRHVNHLCIKMMVEPKL